ncbi:MAG: toxin-antitoxin system YwqK family antitoxin [Flammeovirgaceae bacterium]
MKYVAVVFWIALTNLAFSQGITRYNYYDKEKKNIKEVYQVKDTVNNVLQGRYLSYFLTGGMESKGQFVNNETTGVWEFYYETGNLKMRGILRANSNFGNWEYFYESGQKSMEGTIDGKQKQGVWKLYYESGDLREQGEYLNNKRNGLWTSYFEDGAKKGEINYANDFGRFTEYDHAGKVIAEGPRQGTRNVGLWRFFAEDGTLQSEGNYENGRKNGDWKFFYPSGKISAKGEYENDESVGEWVQYFEDGIVSEKGSYVAGKKNGYWSTFNLGGALRSEITYVNGNGEYREYYPGGKLKIKGPIIDGKAQGFWQYYYEDGKLEGECDFETGKGIYSGYYPNGSLQTKGTIEDNVRVGTWELYEQDGKLSGCYKPVYESNPLSKSIADLLAKKPKPTPKTAQRPKGFYYFTPRYPEYHGVILGGNPALMFIGMMPFSVEFYNQERLGHEFTFVGLRDPFFTADADVPKNKLFSRGYSISVRQKFYNTWKTGMWYFAHQVQLTNLSHFSNIDFPFSQLTRVTATANEQRAEYGILLGVRLMQKNNGNGFTIDMFGGYNIGYRSFDVDPIFKDTFNSLRQSTFSQSVSFGLNIGYSVSFDGRRY